MARVAEPVSGACNGRAYPLLSGDDNSKKFAAQTWGWPKKLFLFSGLSASKTKLGHDHVTDRWHA